MKKDPTQKSEINTLLLLFSSFIISYNSIVHIVYIFSFCSPNFMLYSLGNLFKLIDFILQIAHDSHRHNLILFSPECANHVYIMLCVYNRWARTARSACKSRLSALPFSLAQDAGCCGSAAA